jgi:hypothetical protein
MSEHDQQPDRTAPEADSGERIEDLEVPATRAAEVSGGGGGVPGSSMWAKILSKLPGKRNPPT